MSIDVICPRARFRRWQRIPFIFDEWAVSTDGAMLLAAPPASAPGATGTHEQAPNPEDLARVILQVLDVPDYAIEVSYDDLVAWCGPVPDYPDCDCDERRRRKCPECGGTASYECHYCERGGECGFCDGEGSYPCEDCDGNGKRWERFDANFRRGRIASVFIDRRRLALMLTAERADTVRVWAVEPANAHEMGCVTPGQLGVAWGEIRGTLMGCTPPAVRDVEVSEWEER